MVSCIPPFPSQLDHSVGSPCVTPPVDVAPDGPAWVCPVRVVCVQLIKIIGQYDGLVVRSATKVTKDVIQAGDNLKVIGRAGKPPPPKQHIHAQHHRKSLLSNAKTKDVHAVAGRWG